MDCSKLSSESNRKLCRFDSTMTESFLKIMNDEYDADLRDVAKRLYPLPRRLDDVSRIHSQLVLVLKGEIPLAKKYQDGLETKFPKVKALLSKFTFERKEKSQRLRKLKRVYSNKNIHEIFDAIRPRLFGVAKGYLDINLGQEDLEDIMSDVYLGIFKRGYEEKSYYEWVTILVRSVKLMCINVYRTNERSPDFMNLDLDSLSAVVTDSRSLVLEEGSPLDQIMGKLKAVDRKVMEMALQEKTYREIAEKLGLTEDAVRMRLFRSRGAMRARLAREGMTPSSLSAEDVRLDLLLRNGPAANNNEEYFQVPIPFSDMGSFAEDEEAQGGPETLSLEIPSDDVIPESDQKDPDVQESLMPEVSSLEGSFAGVENEEDPLDDDYDSFAAIEHGMNSLSTYKDLELESDRLVFLIQELDAGTSSDFWTDVFEMMKKMFLKLTSEKNVPFREYRIGNLLDVLKALMNGAQGIEVSQVKVLRTQGMIQNARRLSWRLSFIEAELALQKLFLEKSVPFRKEELGPIISKFESLKLTWEVHRAYPEKMSRVQEVVENVPYFIWSLRLVKAGASILELFKKNISFPESETLIVERFFKELQCEAVSVGASSRETARVQEALENVPLVLWRARFIKVEEDLRDVLDGVPVLYQSYKISCVLRELKKLHDDAEAVGASPKETAGVEQMLEEVSLVSWEFDLKKAEEDLLAVRAGVSVFSRSYSISSLLTNLKRLHDDAERVGASLKETAGVEQMLEELSLLSWECDLKKAEDELREIRSGERVSSEYCLLPRILCDLEKLKEEAEAVGASSGEILRLDEMIKYCSQTLLKIEM